jgi:hypothetical protein
MDFTEQYGDFLGMPINSFSVGSISMTLNDNIKYIQNTPTSQRVYALLSQTGLMCRRF